MNLVTNAYIFFTALSDSYVAKLGKGAGEPVVANGARILLVDDEEDLLSVQQLLKRIGFSAEAFSDLGKALSAFVNAPHSYTGRLPTRTCRNLQA